MLGWRVGVGVGVGVGFDGCGKIVDGYLSVSSPLLELAAIQRHFRVMFARHKEKSLRSSLLPILCSPSRGYACLLRCYCKKEQQGLELGKLHFNM